VREAVLELQRELAKNPPNGASGAVLDGRDCGTVICPAASYKFFIKADTEIRALRRFEELKSLGDATSYQDVLKDMRMRDRRDMKRTTAPLKPAVDAIIIDTSEMTPEEAFQKLLESLERKK
jgi:cytidylate kinase